MNKLLSLTLGSRVILASTCLGLGAAIATLVLASIVEDNTLQLLINLVVTPVATLAAAYTGARIAFELQAKRDRENEASQNVRAVNTAILQLARFAYLFHVIEKQYIAEQRANLARHFQIDAGMAYGVNEMSIDFDSLAFLIHSPNPNLFTDLTAVQLELNATVGVIRERRHWHVERFQVAMDAVPRASVFNNSAEVEEIVGERVAITLKKMTDDVVEGIDNSIAGLRRSMSELHHAAKAMYPTHGVVILNPPSLQ